MSTTAPSEPASIQSPSVYAQDASVSRSTSSTGSAWWFSMAILLMFLWFLYLMIWYVVRTIWPDTSDSSHVSPVSERNDTNIQVDLWTGRKQHRCRQCQRWFDCYLDQTQHTEPVRGYHNDSNDEEGPTIRNGNIVSPDKPQNRSKPEQSISGRPLHGRMRQRRHEARQEQQRAQVVSFKRKVGLFGLPTDEPNESANKSVIPTPCCSMDVRSPSAIERHGRPQTTIQNEGRQSSSSWRAAWRSVSSRTTTTTSSQKRARQPKKDDAEKKDGAFDERVRNRFCSFPCYAAFAEIGLGHTAAGPPLRGQRPDSSFSSPRHHRSRLVSSSVMRRSRET